MIWSACSGATIIPTDPVITPVSRRMRLANGVWYPGPTGILAWRALPPEEQSTTSTPRLFNWAARWTDSSIPKPPSTHSDAEIRTKRGRSAGQVWRIAVVTSRSRRARFSNEPPYWSSRVLLRGERNSCSR